MVEEQKHYEMAVVLSVRMKMSKTKLTLIGPTDAIAEHLIFWPNSISTNFLGRDNISQVKMMVNRF